MPDDISTPIVLPIQPHARLEENVRPPHWTNPSPDGRYNLVVIGAGTAGLVAAAGAAGLGAKVALIERDRMGGDCLNTGCVPSKGLIRSGRAAAAVKQAAEFGIEVPTGVRVDFGRAMGRMRKVRAEISRHDAATRFRDLGVDVYFGEARFTSADSVAVNDRTLQFSKALIATGSRARAPAIEGLDDVDYLTNESVFSLDELPRRFGIIGAGPIGCELGQTFAQLGADVFLVEAEHGILPKEDEDCSRPVREAMERDGVRLLCCGKDVRLCRDDGNVQLQLESHGRGIDQVVDQLLVAVGRAPNVEGLNLEAAGVDTHPHGIAVDDKLRTSNHDIYAAGDVCSKYK